MHVPEPNERPTPDKLIFSGTRTPLSRQLPTERAVMLLDYACEQWDRLHDGLSTWRGKLDMYERMAEEDYSDRANMVDTDRTDAVRPIFERNNHSLGLVSGAVQTVYARAKEDLFGTRPWLSATPEGSEDSELAEKITKHSQWKFDESNLESTFIDAVKLASDLGTCFVKARWNRQSEPYTRSVKVAHSKRDGTALKNEDGDYLYEGDPIPVGRETDTEFREIDIEDSTLAYNNIDAACLDYKDVAFETTAPELSLRHTDFFHQFRMGILDVVAAYGLDEEQKDQLTQLIASDDPTEDAREHRGEDTSQGTYAAGMDISANPRIRLVEGFMRFDAKGIGKPITMHVVFAPDLHTLFRVDYLANLTPDGMLPVFPVRAFKIPKRIIGMGYWEKFLDAHNTVDELFNAVFYRGRESIDAITGYRPDKLKNKLQGQDVWTQPGNMVELAEDVDDIGEVFSTYNKPDLSERLHKLLPEVMQMAQLGLGTATASQGELAGVPSNDTATGSKIIANRGDSVVGCQIDQFTRDLEPALKFCVILNYARQDIEETFVYGEGQDAQLIDLKKDPVQGIRANVSLTLTNTRNLQMLEAAKGAIGIMASYAQLPEPEKESQRRLYIQAVRSLGFSDAEKIVREAAVDPASIAALLPPEIQPAFEAFLQQQGLAPVPGPGGGEGQSAPVIAAA